MKKSKIIGLSLLSVAALGAFAACGNDKKSDTSSNTSSDTSKAYAYIYEADPETLDYTFSGQRYTTENTANFVEGLVSYDQYRQIIPALAESWEVSEDGLTYTYQIREGVSWVDADGNEYDDVKPSDWVTGLKHAADSNSETLYLVADSIVGLADYASGKETDFKKVGIKADDKKGTLTYTLNMPESFWNSKATYGILQPINAEFLKEKGADFGKVAVDSILYNGPYIATKFDNKSAIEYKANESYWDKKNVHIDSIKLSYFDGSKLEELYKGFEDGKYTRAVLYPSMPYYKEVDSSEIIWTPQDAYTYFGYFNLNRQTYANTAHTDDAAKDRTKKALLNKEFRQAFSYAIDKEKFIAQRTGEEGGIKGLRNTILPYDFVTIAGKDYGNTVQTELEDLNPVWKTLSVKQAERGTYNVDLAKATFAKAKEALKAEGVTVSKEAPIVLDVPVRETATTTIASWASLSNTLNTVFDGEVKINSIKLAEDPYLQAAFSFKTAAEADFDFAISGWGPDYADPSTYLNIFGPKSGDIFIKLGLEPEVSLEGEDAGKAVKEAININEYQKLLDKASAIFDDNDKRYEAYAKAEAWLLDNGIVTPIYSGGAQPMMQKDIPFTKIDSNNVGGTTYSFKFREVGDQPLTAADYEKALKEWKAKVEEKAKEADK
ncbi:peptide-binding protein [Lactococcus hodotermopsidis]|uniref:Peptide-binding protein n=1 Tax=Pseudolactococcus hodotermopsidis TaxID=2709157 RepID=A0A6A0BAK8_9LACT|nr:peptide ABC transporter substrate-binding protein [Lactococcus hodotermopsidis]GFH41836.1 peptide-binding protein [Lactococcus hodotermopsidis]